MNKIIFCLFSAILVVLVASCELLEVDTYSTPDATLKGSLKDASGNPFITQQPNGFKIRLIEEGSSQPRDFWGKPDGTFFNSKIFEGTYKIVPTEGAFFSVDTVRMEISGTTTIDFEITPYLTINASIAAEGSNLKATYTIEKAPGTGKIQNSRLLVNKWNPNVGMNYSDENTVRDLSNTSDATIVQTEYIDQIDDYLESGVTYYARIAVLADNPAGKYNFSAVQEIIVP